MANKLFKSLYPHLLAHLAFIIVLLIYFNPIVSGKKLIQNDLIQSVGTLKEAIDTGQKYEEEILWTNTSFGGMPIWRGYSSNILRHIHTTLTNNISHPVLLCYLGFLGFYILILVVGGNAIIAFAGGTAYAFSTFNIISIEAGHINKVFDMALMAPIIAGIIQVYKKRYWSGAFITTLFTGFLIFYGHYQIMYYLLLVIVLISIYYLNKNIRDKNLPHFIKASILLITCALIGASPNWSQLWTTNVYSKSTTRGGSELSSRGNTSKGLDKDYVFAWSNEKMETFTLFVPYFHGGGSSEELTTNSASYKALVNNGVPIVEAKRHIQNMPLYWGDQPFTGGPIYFGASIILLFIFAMFAVQKSFKWWILGLTLLIIALSWGKNFALLSDLFFYFVPLYNKFRSVTMIMSVAQLSVPFLAFIGLIHLYHKKIPIAAFKLSLKWSLGICLGFALFSYIFAGAFTDFIGIKDNAMGLPQWFIEAIRTDRADKFRSDILRSSFFVLSTCILLWAFFKEKLKPIVFIFCISIVILIDLIPVNKRYLNNTDFQTFNSWEKDIFPMSKADKQIIQDSSYYRVFNATRSTFNDATTSFYHNSIGGYSAIKLQRYQEVIDSLIMKNNMRALDMLNTKYFILPNKQTGESVVQRNFNALGNVWFVDSIKMVNNADEEIYSLQNFLPKSTAIIDKRFEEYLNDLSIQKDSTATINLTNYHPNRLRYTYQASKEQFAVFSEIYYQPGWNAYIDGELTPHVRVNYILRGMKLPSGKHSIEFKFEPKHYFEGEKISKAGSIIMILALASFIGMGIYTRKKAID